MNLAGNLKKNVGEFFLRKKTKNLKRKTVSCNLHEAKNIGVLFNATHLVSFEIVKEFVKQLSTPSNNVSVLGYVDSKQMIDHYLYRKGFEFFTRNDLNWFQKPENEGVTTFIEQKFDLLVDLNLEESFPMKYILSLSNATFKTGKYTANHNLLDFMINIESEKKVIKDLQTEIVKDKQKISSHSSNYDKIADKKTDVELQLNFLINQLVHYLSKLNK
jgi:hypothetical protein